MAGDDPGQPANQKSDPRPDRRDPAYRSLPLAVGRFIYGTLNRLRASSLLLLLTLWRPFVRVWNMEANHWIAVGTIIMSCFTAGLYWTSWEQWQLGRDQLNQTKLMFATQYRPWIIADVGISSPLTIDDKGAVSMTLSFVFKNIGKSVARNVVVAPTFRHFSFEDSESVAAWQDEECQMARGLGQPPALGLSLFPEEQLRRDIEWTSISVLKNTHSPLDDEHRKFFTPIVIICIDYGFPFGPLEHHQTSYIFHLFRKPRRAIEITQGSIPAEELRLEPFYLLSLERKAD